MSTVGDTKTPRWVRGRKGRSSRRVAAVRAAYAQDLQGQLRALVGGRDVALRTSSVSAELQERLRSAAGAASSAVWVWSAEGELDLVAAHGRQTHASESALWHGLAIERPSWRDETLVLPLRVGSEVFGAVALGEVPAVDPARLAGMQEIADEHAVRLDTALLLDGVRTSATSEERRRVAREIHDGVAQRIVALGYLADDVALLARDEPARQAVESLRDQITGIAGDLRLSLRDLRSDLALEDGISGALSAYVDGLGSRSDLRIHLHLDERGHRPPRGVEREVFAIAQEAISNVRRHAHAINLWIALTTDGHEVRLVIEDDGTGAVAPCAGHYGLQGMSERAEQIDATLEIGVRPDGGTVVTLQTGATGPSTRDGDSDDHQRLAGR
jgi:signal transduction histidine kinase